jgi:hypothetical protein
VARRSEVFRDDTARAAQRQLGGQSCRVLHFSICNLQWLNLQSKRVATRDGQDCKLSIDQCQLQIDFEHRGYRLV